MRMSASMYVATLYFTVMLYETENSIYVLVELGNITIALWKNETYGVACIPTKSQASTLNVFCVLSFVFNPPFFFWFILYAVRFGASAECALVSL